MEYDSVLTIVLSEFLIEEVDLVVQHFHADEDGPLLVRAAAGRLHLSRL